MRCGSPSRSSFEIGGHRRRPVVAIAPFAFVRQIGHYIAVKFSLLI
jgi:hypothetical protein